MISIPSALSPTPKKKKHANEGKTLNFNEAIAKIISGKKIYKLEWNDKGYYGVMKEGRLKLHKPDGQLYDWVISDGDLLGEDWIVI